MRNVSFLLILSTFFLSCNNETKNTPAEEEFSEEKMSSFLKEFSAKEPTKSQVVNYLAVTGQSTTANMLDALSTANPLDCAALPTKISDLNSGSGFEYYKFSSEQSAEAKAFGFGGTISKKELLIIRDYVRYKLVTCGTGEKKIGIGLRCFIHVKKLKGSLSATLANIAGSVQLDRGNAMFSLKSMGFGIGGDIIAEGLSGQGDFNVENFANLEVTFNNVLKTLKDSSTLSISPVELPKL